MKTAKFLELIGQPDSERFECILHLEGVHQTAQLLSGFANTSGGSLVLGYRRTGKGAEYYRIDSEHELGILNDAIAHIGPGLKVVVEEVHVNENPLLVVNIPEGTWKPYQTGGCAFERKGRSMVPLTADTIIQNINVNSKNFKSALEEAYRLSRVFEIANRELIYRNSWTARIMDMVIGGLAGAVIATILTLVLSA